MLIAWRSRSMPLQTDSPMPDNHFVSVIGRSSWSRFARSSVNPMRLLVRIGSAQLIAIARRFGVADAV